MKIHVERRDGKWYVHFPELPGSPPCGHHEDLATAIGMLVMRTAAERQIWGSHGVDIDLPPLHWVGGSDPIEGPFLSHDEARKVLARRTDDTAWIHTSNDRPSFDRHR
jgi:3-hydroxymyristoyl/3-hydroxydecanoyl-(acyl carrier protein) dehydratase